jgi:hypothetical protein
MVGALWECHFLWDLSTSEPEDVLKGNIPGEGPFLALLEKLGIGRPRRQQMGVGSPDVPGFRTNCALCCDLDIVELVGLPRFAVATWSRWDCKLFARADTDSMIVAAVVVDDNASPSLRLRYLYVCACAGPVKARPAR